MPPWTDEHRKNWYASRLNKGHDFDQVGRVHLIPRHNRSFREPELVLVPEVPEQTEDPAECQVLTRMVVYKAVRRLEPLQRYVIISRFGLIGEPMTLEAIGNNLGLTREQVRTLEDTALNRLRGLMAEKPWLNRRTQ